MTTTLALKRSRVDEESVERFVMENCVNIMKRNESLGRRMLIECKTCKKQFDSYQALGGHKASHKNKAKKLKMMNTTDGLLPVEPKKYKCSHCGQEFAVGQALGGHMKKHRDKLNQLKQQQKNKLKENSKSGKFGEALDEENSKSSGRIFFMDLNLTPYENELMRGITPT